MNPPNSVPRGPHKQVLAEWGEFAVEQARDQVVDALRKKLAALRDPRMRLLRRRRRARRAFVASSTATGVFGGGALLAFSPQILGEPLQAFTAGLLDVSGAGLGAMALATGAAAVGAGARYRRLKHTALPPPAPDPVALPPVGSRAREPMQRLRDGEQSLHEVLAQLAAPAAGVPQESVADAGAAAGEAAAFLRGVADRLCAVEGALPHAPPAERAALEADVERLRRELDEGVDGYGSLVAAAGRAVAASGAATARHPEQRRAVQDATDRLAGLAAALHDLAGHDLAGQTPRSPVPDPRDSGESGQDAPGRGADEST